MISPTSGPAQLRKFLQLIVTYYMICILTEYTAPVCIRGNGRLLLISFNCFVCRIYLLFSLPHQHAVWTQDVYKLAAKLQYSVAGGVASQRFTHSGMQFVS
jgi:hypothetical protein